MKLHVGRAIQHRGNTKDHLAPKEASMNRERPRITREHPGKRVRNLRQHELDKGEGKDLGGLGESLYEGCLSRGSGKGEENTDG